MVDIRSPEQFADYHLPGSESVSISDLLVDPQLIDLDGNVPLILVDRDGSLALIVAGMLAQKTDRPLKALAGGLQAYWNEVGVGAAARGSAINTTPLTPSYKPPVGAAPVKSTPKRRRSAGC